MDWEDTLHCKNCDTEMELISVDEADFGYEWCPNCGTLFIGEDFDCGEWKEPKNNA